MAHGFSRWGRGLHSIEADLTLYYLYNEYFNELCVKVDLYTSLSFLL